MRPQVMLWEIMNWDMSLWGRLAGSNVFCASTDPTDLCPKAEPWEQRRLTLYTLASRFRSKKQSSTHIWLLVISLVISFPQCYLTFTFQFFKFCLSALPSPPSVSSSEHSLSVSYLASPFLLHYEFPNAGIVLFFIFNLHSQTPLTI
jgi:hypothetical protein